MPAIKLLSEDMALYFGSGVLLIGTSFLQMINRAHLFNISMYIKLKYHMCHQRNIRITRGNLYKFLSRRGYSKFGEMHIRFYKVYI